MSKSQKEAVPDDPWSGVMTGKDINRAAEWRRNHAKHVDELNAEATVAVAPSGSDVVRPELWKSMHWAWYAKATAGR
jgi:hypothetical protein